LKTLGRHLLVELYQCDSRVIGDVRKIEEIMVGAAKAAKATIVDVVFHNFNPNGISGVIVIAESHLAIHTWPEFGFASIDIYTCGTAVNPWKAYDHLCKHFKAKNVTAMEFKRGLLGSSKKISAR
jgi:S-adenosylmethionine decarboxylase proenzyme